MSFFETLKRHPRYIIIPLFCLFLAFYFTYHTITGERGLLRFLALKKEIKKEETLAKEIRRNRLDIQANVNALSPESMDLDMLDEIGRKTLNVGEEKDYLIFERPESDQKTQSVESSD